MSRAFIREDVDLPEHSGRKRSASGLPPGATSKPVSVKSNFGYKGSEPRTQMLENRLFVDAKVEIFAKYSSLQWKRIAEFPIERKLIAQ